MLGHVGLGVLLQVELATVPWHAGIDAGDGGLEALVSIAGDR